MDWHSLRLFINHRTDFPIAACRSHFCYVIEDGCVVTFSEWYGTDHLNGLYQATFLIAMKKKWELTITGSQKIRNLRSSVKVSRILFYFMWCTSIVEIKAQCSIVLQVNLTL